MKISNFLQNSGWRERPNEDVFCRHKLKYGFGWQVAQIHEVDQEIMELRLVLAGESKKYQKGKDCIWRPIDLRTGNYYPTGWGES